MDISLVQGTEEWLTARKTRIGGSEIASILRISPYKTRMELWEEKTGDTRPASISHMPHVQRGILAEPIARDMIASELGVNYTTPTCVHVKYGYLVGSVDGLCEDHVLEIKTMSKAKHIEAAAGVIPQYYVCQLQWNMCMSNRTKGLYASYRPEDGSMHKIWLHEDKEYQRHMVAKALQFYRWVKRKQLPPPDFVF